MDRNVRQPTNRDGFETGDYRNFAPVYLGDESEWIRPTATVTDENPIAGECSLQWTANDDPHHWALLSNAFHLTPPVAATVTIRIDAADEAYGIGIGFAETRDRPAVLRATDSGIELTTDSWTNPSTESDVILTPGDVYEFELALTDDGLVTATVSDDDDTVAELQAETALTPNALALTVNTAADSDTTLTFDDVSIEAAPYRVTENEWTRSPQFVVLPRKPDVGEDQGNWVGAPTVIDEGNRLRLWYRIRNNEQRGAGFGLAESRDGLTWEKSDENPVLLPDHGQDSNEGLSVLQVDGSHHTWYTINRDGTWHIVYATSDDGSEWTDHGIVIEGYCKDPVVLFVDGTYYLYAIAPSNTEFSVYTSTGGREWSRENTIEFENHGHPGAYYVEETETFWLYAFAEEGTDNPPAHVRRAASDDGIHFDRFEPTWQDPPVGLDGRPPGGIDYGAVPGDGHRHLAHDRRVLMYYQARHNYHNNRPGWRMAGDGLVVLGGRFTGLFEGVSTIVGGDGDGDGDDGYSYKEFPMHAPSISDLSLTADRPATATVEQWTPADDTVARLTVETEDETTLTLTADGLNPDSDYTLAVGDDTDTVPVTADADGTATAEVNVPAVACEEIELRNDAR